MPKTGVELHHAIDVPQPDRHGAPWLRRGSCTRTSPYPLPEPIAGLRQALYPRLVPVANRWHEAMKISARFPESHQAFLERCHAAGQTRPTPLLLKYGAGDFNALHQDFYGDLCFPCRSGGVLSRPDQDYTGGEFLLPSSVRA